ncbi:helix-turn-helix transcriptional regulator [Lysinibacillus sphaericus]|uniref:AraC family transcriptional regulator n=1 Tax=Lysinibacillus sphaericus TaxID=1421 RepID=UPI003D023030
MVLDTLTTSFHQNFSHFFNALEVSKKLEAPTEYMTFQSSIREGAIHRLIPRSDLEVVISDYSFYRDHQMHVTTMQPMVELSFCMQGARGINISGSDHEIASGTCSLQFIEQAGANFLFHKNEAYQMIGIGIPVPTFNYFMQEVSGRRDNSIEFAHVLGEKSYRIFQEKTDPSASIIVKRILDAVKDRHMTKLALESSALQLLALSFQTFLFNNNPKPSEFSKSDVEKIRQARAIIIECMTEPPTLIELSRLIALNDYKLKKGFKEMYGATVFGYLREKRLEKAFLLLQGGKMNVNEVSNEVGYSNPSYFAQTFKDKYGINPSKLVRDQRILEGLDGK